MPLPKPNSGESRDDFLKRCMANPTMNSEYEDQKQRYAVCNDLWRKREVQQGGPTAEDWAKLGQLIHEVVHGDKG